MQYLNWYWKLSSKIYIQCFCNTIQYFHYNCIIFVPKINDISPIFVSNPWCCILKDFRDLKWSYLELKRVLFVTLQLFFTGYLPPPPSLGRTQEWVMILCVKIKHSRPLIHNHVLAMLRHVRLSFGIDFSCLVYIFIEIVI